MRFGAVRRNALRGRDGGHSRHRRNRDEAVGGIHPGTRCCLPSVIIAAALFLSELLAPASHSSALNLPAPVMSFARNPWVVIRESARWREGRREFWREALQVRENTGYRPGQEVRGLLNQCPVIGAGFEGSLHRFGTGRTKGDRGR